MTDGWSDDETMDETSKKTVVETKSKPKDSNDNGWGDDNMDVEETAGTNDRGGKGQSRPGDWICEGCQNKNFAFRKECQRCKEPKAGGDDGGGKGQSRPGDWICEGCQNKNFAFRKECQRCKEPKTGGDDGGGYNNRDNSDRESRPRREKNDRPPRDNTDRPPRERNGEDGEEEKKERPPIYTPPEPTEKEEEIYGSGISAGINFDNFDKIDVAVTNGGEPVNPITTFENSGLRKFLLDNVEKSGYMKPTPIQKYAIPMIMAGRDLMGCAQTGSGKTAAFCLPIINKIMNDGTPENVDIGCPICLIVAPTRELAIQIHDEARKFSRGSWVKVALVYGGTATRYQAERLDKGCHILVATTGRLMDFVNKEKIKFNSLKFLVLDEADRMLEMGFKEAINTILEHNTLNKNSVQKLLFSATFPSDIQRLAATYLRDYIFLQIGIVGGASNDVVQEVIEVTHKEKRKKLGEILGEKDSEKDRVLVFVESKKTADFLASFMSDTKLSTTSIHGDRSQCEREQALRDFRTGKHKVLVATSVAARGLDIKGVTHVINYDLPRNIQDYVHRIGRTGRVGNKGQATSFFNSDKDMEMAPLLARVLEDSNQEIPEFLGLPSEASVELDGKDCREGVDAGKKQEDDEDW